MVNHIRSNCHGPSLSSSKYVTSITLYKCQVCRELMLCDYYIVVNHLSKKHNLSVVAYKNITKLPNQKDEFSKYQNMLKCAIQDIPAIRPRKACALPANSLSNDETTQNVGNISSFKCLVCQKSTMSHTCLRQHYKTRHHINYNKYNAEQVIEARYHQCHICAKTILCDNIFLTRHLTNSHKTTMREYIKDHVFKNGGAVYPTFKDYQKNNYVFEVMSNSKQTMQTEDQDNGLILPSMLSSESEDSDEE